MSIDSKKIIRRKFTLDRIISEGQVNKNTFELEKHSSRVVGAMLTADQDNHLFHRGFFGLLINGTEVFPMEYYLRRSFRS